MTPTAALKDVQQSVTWFLTLENVLGSEIHMKMVWCVALRMLSQNLLWTDQGADSCWDKRL